MEQKKDTTYYASTDYNQRLEEKEEEAFEQKAKIFQSISQTTDDINEAIQTKDLVTLHKLAQQPLTEDWMQKLLAIGDKDIYIALARNPSITPTIARSLIGTVYLAHKELLRNPNVCEEIKQELTAKLKNNPLANFLFE